MAEPLATWIPSARSQSVEAFCRLHANPFLLVEQEPPRADAQVMVATGKLQAVPKGATSAAQVLTLVHPVVKRQAAFPGMITIGRAPNNDVVLAIATVSTFHGWFAQDARGGWTLHEARATHGTWVGDKQLLGQPAALSDDAQLRFGVTNARFVSSRKLHALLAGV